MSSTENAPPALDAGASISGETMDRRLPQKGRRRRRIALIVGAAAFLLIGGVSLIAILPPPGSLMVKAADLEIGQASRQPFQDYLPVRAEVAPLVTDFVSTVSGGQVETVLALDGTVVVAGQALAQLSNPALKLDVSAKEADIAGRLSEASAQSLALERNRIDRDKEVSETSYGLLKSQHDLDVRRELHEKGFVSDAEVKTFSDEASYYRERLKTLKDGQRQEADISRSQAAQIRQTSARLNSSLEGVRASLEALTIRAPASGRLTDFTIQPGRTVKPGEQVGQIDSEGRYKLVADVDEFYLGRVAPGQAGAADLDAAAQALTVTRALPQVANGRFRVEFAFDHTPQKPLRRGESVDLKITLGDTRPALVLANGPWLEDSGGAYAFVLSKDGRRADRRGISVGRRTPDQVEITKGLGPGEKVVTSSYAAFEKSFHLILR